MADFTKLDFAVSFNPATAFPLDARSYFDSLSAAEAAAANAVEVGSNEGVYYFGQTLTVVENNVAKFYIIQPDKTLSAVTGDDDEPVKVLVDENQFEYTEDNKLILKGAASAVEGQVLAMSANGALAWVTPVDAYSKTETDAKIAAAAHLKRKVVDSVSAIEVDADDAMQYIYMVPNGLTLDDDRYDEYMVVEVGEDENKTRFVEKVGTWAVDLADYAKSADVEATYVKKNGTDRLITAEEADRIAESEKNVIASVSSDFSIDENRQLNLNNISISKVTDLEKELNAKVDAVKGYSLISQTDKDKLDALVIGEDGSVGISGSINASNVKELDTWITTKRDDVDGLLSTAQETRLEGLFDVVNNAEFVISDTADAKKQLDLLLIPMSKVDGLSQAIEDAKSSVIEDITEQLNAYVKLDVYAADKATIMDAITWGELN